MRKSFVEILEYLFLPNTLYLGFKNVRSDYISRPIPHCRGIPREDATGPLVVKSRRFCRKSQWRPRYCVISNEELFIYKDRTGRSEDVETRRINLANAVKIRVLSWYRVPKKVNKMKRKRGKIMKRKGTPKPVCFLKIVDESKKKFELGIMDVNDVVYWMASICASFFGTEHSTEVCTHEQLTLTPPVPDCKSFVVRSTVEETHTYAVKSAVILERNMLNGESPGQFHKRHWTSTSMVEAHDELLPPSTSSGATRRPSSYPVRSKPIAPYRKKSPNRAVMLDHRQAAISLSRAVLKKAKARAIITNKSPIRAY